MKGYYFKAGMWEVWPETHEHLLFYIKACMRDKEIREFEFTSAETKVIYSWNNFSAPRGWSVEVERNVCKFKRL